MKNYSELQLGFDMPAILPKKRNQISLISKSRDLSQDIAEAVSFQGASSSLNVLSVHQLTRQITKILEEGIGAIWVAGEISNLRHQTSGHSYFTLKDEHSQLPCVLFARVASQQKNSLRDGLQVHLYGQITVYQARGHYQMIVSRIKLDGDGILHARFAELKRRLAEEGLFDQKRKRPLPKFPRRIGIVTSPTGAAIHDFLQVLQRRHPGIHVLINPVRVQGKGAATEIATAIAELSKGGDPIGLIDLIIVTRGGGSFEDLWEFNEEVVARAIVASAVPVVTAIGHEIDFSIADFVADLRAPTPSAAAEMITADGVQLLDRCRSLTLRIKHATMSLLSSRISVVRLVASSSLFRDPNRRLHEMIQITDRFEEILLSNTEKRLNYIQSTLETIAALLSSIHPSRKIDHVRHLIISIRNRLDSQIIRRMENDLGKVERLRIALAALSPQATLARGFSITQDVHGRVITSASQIKIGTRLQTILRDGVIDLEVCDCSQ